MCKMLLFFQFQNLSSRENTGESILHLWIEKFREHLQHQGSNVEKDVNDETVPPSAEEIPKKFQSLDLEDSKAECPSIISADPFTERKSTFQGHAATVTNASQVK